MKNNEMVTYYMINGDVKEEKISSIPTSFPRYNGVWGEDKRINAFPLNKKEFLLNDYLTPRVSDMSEDNVKYVIEYDGQPSEYEGTRSLRKFVKDLINRKVNWQIYMVKGNTKHRIPARENGQKHGITLLKYSLRNL